MASALDFDPSRNLYHASTEVLSAAAEWHSWMMGPWIRGGNTVESSNLVAVSGSEGRGSIYARCDAVDRVVVDELPCRLLCERLGGAVRI